MFSEMFCTKNNTHVNPLYQLSTILFLPTYLLLYKKSECFTSHGNNSKSIVVITSNNKIKYSSGIGIDNRIVMESGNNNDEELDMEMEMGGSNVNGNGGVAGSSSRWNPTKEQISMLENLYKQGIKTPSAEEIQQITARLRAYGHIEGKNVFYWFQNHKARQRQKQKQETFAYFNRFLHTPQPFFSPPICPNGSFFVLSFLNTHSCKLYTFILFFNVYTFIDLLLSCFWVITKSPLHASVLGMCVS